MKQQIYITYENKHMLMFVYNYVLRVPLHPSTHAHRYTHTHKFKHTDVCTKVASALDLIFVSIMYELYRLRI